MALAILFIVLLPFFLPSLKPSMIHFSNDGPYGANSAAYSDYPSVFTGIWQDLNWLGGESVAPTPSFTNLQLWLLGPKWFAKTYAPAALLLLGFAAWLFFRQLGLGQSVALLGAIAMAINGNRLSIACWGLASWVYSTAAVFLALAGLIASTSQRPWLMSALAGFATGMAVMEGFDTGALFSLVVAAYGLFLAWLQPGERKANLIRGGLKVGLVSICAAFLATQILVSLVNTQIAGVVGAKQDEATRKRQRDFAMQWSLPKIELLRVAIPGLFGYRMETPNGGNYWGTIGRSPGWEQHKQGFARHSGSGEYAGVAVCLLALFALVQSFRKKNSAFSEHEKLHVRFWGIIALGSLLLAFGKFAPFYQFFYELPYASTIRNPVKFMHIFQVALVILFAFGAHAAFKSVWTGAGEKSRPFLDHLKAWWESLKGFDRNWLVFLFGLLGVSIFSWLLYSAKKPAVEAYLATQGFTAADAGNIVGFSLAEFGWSVFFLLLSITVIGLILSGFWRGAKAHTGALLLGLILFADLGRATLPWILYWDLNEKYAANPVLEFLKKDAHEHRVSVIPFAVNQPMQILQQLYGIEWSQHLFLHNNIQSIDVTQESRTLEENEKYRAALRSSAQTLTRFWELTNTKYLLGLSNPQFIQAIGQQIDGGRQRLRVILPFDVVSRNPTSTAQVTLDKVTAVPSTNGQMAVLEFTGALPRVRLYSNWLITTNDSEILSLLANGIFDPHQSVIVANSIPQPPPTAMTNTAPGEVKFTSYAPKLIRFHAECPTPSVLLHNDKHNPNWKVTVDGQPAELLRCNYLMRGVYLNPGSHEIEFRYEPSTKALKITLVAWVFCLGILGFVIAVPPRQTEGRSEQNARPSNP